MIDYYCFPDNVETDLMMASCLKSKGVHLIYNSYWNSFVEQTQISQQALRIMECRYSTEMNYLLHVAFCDHCSSSLKLIQSTNPMFDYCLELLYEYKLMRHYNLIPPHIENLITEANFRIDVDLFLEQVCAGKYEVMVI